MQDVQFNYIAKIFITYKHTFKTFKNLNYKMDYSINWDEYYSTDFK